MQTRTVGSLAVSVIGLGCNNFGGRLDAAATKSVLDASLAAGVTFLDTADIYGDTLSETFMGQALRGRRDDFVLATKFGYFRSGQANGGGRPEYVRSALEASLKRLQVDHIDLYQYHKPDPTVPLAETMGALTELVERGLVREIGCSNFSAEQLAEAEAISAAGGSRFVTVQNEYSMLHREPEASVLPACHRYDIGFLPYFPLLSGILSGKYRRGQPMPEGTRVTPDSHWAARLTPATLDLIEELVAYAQNDGRELLDLAFAWLLAEPAVKSVIAGATSPQQVQRNAQAADYVMSSEARTAVSALLAEFSE